MENSKRRWTLQFHRNIVVNCFDVYYTQEDDVDEVADGASTLAKYPYRLLSIIEVISVAFHCPHYYLSEQYWSWR